MKNQMKAYNHLNKLYIVPEYAEATKELEEREEEFVAENLEYFLEHD